MKHVSAALEDPDRKVFQILGHFGIGKRIALAQLLKQRGIEPVEHACTNIESDEPLKMAISKHPNAVHLWDYVFCSNIVHPAVSRLFAGIESGSIPFFGTFILAAND